MQSSCENCTLCAKSFEVYKNKEKHFREVLNLLFICLEEDAPICTTCLEKINKVYEFKKMCLNSKKYNEINKEKHHLKYSDICQMCRIPHEEDVASFFTFLENNNMQTFFERYFPEITLSSREHCVICKSCICEMKYFMNFFNERSIMGQLKQLKTSNKQLVVILNKIDLSKGIDVNMKGNPHTVNTEHPDYIINEKIPQGGVEYFCENCRIGGKCNHIVVREQKDTDPGKFHCANCDYVGSAKYLLKLHMLVHKTPFETKMFKCKDCSYETKYRNALSAHEIIHKNLTEVKVYKCNICDFETKHRSSLRGHIKVHKTKDSIKTFDCPYCDYKAKLRGNLRSHLITHQSPDSVKWYTCNTCDFSTRYKANFRRHLIVHKGPGETKMIKCQFCDYKSKHLGMLMIKWTAWRSWRW